MRKNRTPIPYVLLCAGFMTAGCEPFDSDDPQPARPTAPIVNVNGALKSLDFSWAPVSSVTHYRLLENPDGSSGFTQVGVDIPVGTTSTRLRIAVHLHDFVNALYIVQACNDVGCTNSTETSATDAMLDTIGYFKASNSEGDDWFSDANGIALSADGSTLAIGAWPEDSNATGIDGDEQDNSSPRSGAVYVFRFDGTDWYQQAYLKASNTQMDDGFGTAVSLSADGNTLAVSAPGESSSATGIDGDQSDNSAIESGAVYLFRFEGASWLQEAYIKASNTDSGDRFGEAVALSADGQTLAVGAFGEDSNATGIDGNQTDNSAGGAGAVYLFRYDGTNWAQQSYLKASNTDSGDEFGWAVALSSNGKTLAVSAREENSGTIGINGGQDDETAEGSGAVYLFRNDDTAWSQQAYIKASNTDAFDTFGEAVALSANGQTLAVGALDEDSSATGIDGDQNDNSAGRAGAVYLFRLDGTDWIQAAYLKASNTEFSDLFGSAVALSADGNTLAVGAGLEFSGATGVGGDQNDNSAPWSGAVYVFGFDGMTWSQTAYVKAPNAETEDGYGKVVLSADGETMAVGAPPEDSNATGIGGDQGDNSAENSGAVYLY